MNEEIKLPKVSFSTFVMSMHSSAIFAFGKIEDPVTKQKTKNLTMAKQTIDVLGMLEEKTKGNLTEEEDKLIKHILHDLRMAYVKEK